MQELPKFTEEEYREFREKVEFKYEYYRKKYQVPKNVKSEEEIKAYADKLHRLLPEKFSPEFAYEVASKKAHSQEKFIIGSIESIVDLETKQDRIEDENIIDPRYNTKEEEIQKRVEDISKRFGIDPLGRLYTIEDAERDLEDYHRHERTDYEQRLDEGRTIRKELRKEEIFVDVKDYAIVTHMENSDYINTSFALNNRTHCFEITRKGRLVWQFRDFEEECLKHLARGGYDYDYNVKNPNVTNERLETQIELDSDRISEELFKYTNKKLKNWVADYLYDIAVDKAPDKYKKVFLKEPDMKEVPNATVIPLNKLEKQKLCYEMSEQCICIISEKVNEIIQTNGSKREFLTTRDDEIVPGGGEEL